MRLLIVEDDSAIAEPLMAGLLHHGFEAVHVSNGASAIAAIREQSFDVVLLDLGLPDMDGLDVCRDLRASTSVPIIMVTARNDEVDRVVGLELGADDYVSKPFGVRELIARIRAVRRRFDATSDPAVGPVGLLTAAPIDTTSFNAAPIDSAPKGFAPFDAASVNPTPINTAPKGSAPFDAASFDSGPINTASVDSARVDSTEPQRTSLGAESNRSALGALEIDQREHRVRLNGQELALSPKEYGVLAALFADPGAVVTRASLIEQVWDEHWYGPTKTLDVHIAQLRQKLGNSGWIETVRGVGFRLADPNQSAAPGAGNSDRPSRGSEA